MKLVLDGTNEIKTRRLNPGIPIPAEATKIHGITDADVVNEPSFRQIARSLTAHLEGCDLCGYNIWKFDLPLLTNEFKRAEVPFSVEGKRIIDPCRIFHQREPRDLTAALRFFCGMEHDGAHGAEADVLATLLVLDSQVERYEDLPRTIPELHDAMKYPDIVGPDGKFVRRDDGVIVFAFSNHSGKPVDEVARTHPGFLQWMIMKIAFSDEAKSVAREALARQWAKQAVPMHVD